MAKRACICRDPANCLLCMLDEPDAAAHVLTRLTGTLDGGRRIAPRPTDGEGPRGGGEQRRMFYVREFAKDGQTRGRRKC